MFYIHLLAYIIPLFSKDFCLIFSLIAINSLEVIEQNDWQSGAIKRSTRVLRTSFIGRLTAASGEEIDRSAHNLWCIRMFLYLFRKIYIFLKKYALRIVVYLMRNNMN